MELRGTAAVVSGGGSGLGLASVRTLAARGATVHVLARNPVALPTGVTLHEVDVTDSAAVGRALDHVAQEGNPLRVVVNCAGVGLAQRLLSQGSVHSSEAFSEVMRVNALGTFNVLVSGASVISTTPPMEDGLRGVVINTSSLAASEGQVGQVAYAASKGAVDAMTLPAARDLASAGIRVVTIAPGIFATEALERIGDERLQRLTSGIPSPQRPGQPDEFAQLVLSVVDNAYLNGVVLRLDGGLRMAAR